MNEWHAVSKADYYRRFPDTTLSYDSLYPHTAKEKSKYIYLDEGTSGAYILEKATGDIYRIKGYGVINRARVIGNLETITGTDLFLKRW
jgi:hypothetical protein